MAAVGGGAWVELRDAVRRRRFRWSGEGDRVGCRRREKEASQSRRNPRLSGRAWRERRGSFLYTVARAGSVGGGAGHSGLSRPGYQFIPAVWREYSSSAATVGGSRGGSGYVPAETVHGRIQFRGAAGGRRERRVRLAGQTSARVVPPDCGLRDRQSGVRAVLLDRDD